MGGFMKAFRDKGRLSPLLESIPVRIIMNEMASLLGAAFRARELSISRLPDADR
jgi:glucokinase